MNLFDSSSYSEPKFNDNCLYQLLQADSKIQSLNNSSCSSDFYESPRGRLLEEALKNELIRSEKRRSSLVECLKDSHNALQHQRKFLQQQDSDILGNKTRIDNLLLRQEDLASKVSNLQLQDKVSRDLVTLNIKEFNEKENQRFPKRLQVDIFTDNNKIVVLEREIDNIKMKIKAQAPITHILTNDLTRFGLNNEEDKKGYMEEVHQDLQKFAQKMAANCSNAQQERDALELQITSLHSEIFKTKIYSKELQKQCAELQSQLLAGRNINEGLNLELSYLKQHTGKLEDTIKVEESKKKTLNLQVENLEREKQQLLSQKELLSKMLKAKKKNRKHSSGKLSTRSPNQLLTLENQSEESSEERKRKEKDQEFNMFSTMETPSVKTQCRKARRSERNKVIKCEENGRDNIQNTERQIIPVKKHRKGKQDEFGNKKNVLMMETKSSLPSQDSSHVTDKCSKSSKLSYTSKGQSEVVVACYQCLTDLLGKLEYLLKSNARLDYEKDQVLKYLVGIIKELKDAKILNEKSREQVENLLDEHMNLKEACFTSGNQITSVVVELKQLRKAYNGIIKHSDDPEDKKAILWISRVQAIKDSLKNIKGQEKKIKSMEKENYLMTSEFHESLKYQKRKQQSTA